MAKHIFEKALKDLDRHAAEAKERANETFGRLDREIETRDLAAARKTLGELRAHVDTAHALGDVARSHATQLLSDSVSVRVDPPAAPEAPAAKAK